MWLALLITSLLTCLLGVLVARTLAAAQLHAVVESALVGYLESCKSLPEMEDPTGSGYKRLDPAEREAVLRSAILLVRLVDTLYFARDERATEWAVCLDDYAPLLSDRSIAGYASHPETAAAIQEARGGGVSPIVASPPTLQRPSAARPSLARPSLAIPAEFVMSQTRLVIVISVVWIAGVAVGALAFLWGYADGLR